MMLHDVTRLQHDVTVLRHDVTVLRHDVTVLRHETFMAVLESLKPSSIFLAFVKY